MIKIVLLGLVVSFILVLNPTPAGAVNLLGSEAQCNSQTAGTGSSAVCTDTSQTNSNPNRNPIVDKLQNIAKIISIVAGSAAVIILIVASIQYITSDGDSNKINNAKKAIIYSLVGLAIIVLAAVIIEFVLNKL